MKPSVRIGLVGDYSQQVRAHVAIPKALALMSGNGVVEAQSEWLLTRTIKGSVSGILSKFDAVWCVPASPYRNMEGVLEVIRYVRENGIPFLGTCGGFQHALIEFARNRLGYLDADHAESNPNAALALISPLSCSLVGKKGRINLRPGSHIARIYGQTEALEEYHCNYGFNRQFENLLGSSELMISGTDQNGEVRVVELSGHPFFLATLFQPELSALTGVSHPLIEAFVRAAAAQENDPLMARSARTLGSA